MLRAPVASALDVEPTWFWRIVDEVRIRLTGGEEFAARVDHQQASPQRPFTSTDVRAKFAANAGLGLGDGHP